jgi:hypothetical protein
VEVEVVFDHAGAGASGRPRADGQRLFPRRKRSVGALTLGFDERTRRRDPDRRVEEHDALDTLRLTRGELEREAGAEAVPDPRGALDPQCVRRLDEIADVRLQIPWWLPLGVAVTAKVQRDDAVPT